MTGPPVLKGLSGVAVADFGKAAGEFAEALGEGAGVGGVGGGSASIESEGSPVGDQCLAEIFAVVGAVHEGMGELHGARRAKRASPVARVGGGEEIEAVFRILRAESGIGGGRENSSCRSAAACAVHLFQDRGEGGNR